MGPRCRARTPRVSCSTPPACTTGTGCLVLSHGPRPRTRRPDDLSGHAHRQVIGYLGLALPFMLVQAERLRPNAPSDQWLGNSLSAYYWTGAVSLFAGILAVLAVHLLTYQGYRNE